MAVVGTAKQIGQGRSGEELEDGVKRFFRTYLVRTDSVNDGPNVARSATGLPALGDPYSGHPTAVCVGLFPRPVSGTYLAWHVEAEFSTHSIDRDDNPLATKPEIEYGYESYDEPIAGTAKNIDVSQSQSSSNEDGSPATDTQGTNGYYGFPITNSADEPLPGILSAPNFYPVIRITRNEPSFDALKAVQYGNTVNAESWNGLLPRQAWLKPINATSMVQYASGIDQPDIRYWRVSYTFVLKADTWDKRFLNIGRRYRTAAGQNSFLPFQDKHGNTIWDLLKADGTRYAPNTTAANKKATWRVFRVLREVSFGPLAINLNLGLNELRKRPRAS